MPTKPDLMKLMDELNYQIEAAGELSENSRWAEIADVAASIERAARKLEKHYSSHASRMEYYRTHRGDASVSNAAGERQPPANKEK